MSRNQYFADAYTMSRDESLYSMSRAESLDEHSRTQLAHRDHYDDEDPYDDLDPVGHRESGQPSTRGRRNSGWYSPQTHEPHTALDDHLSSGGSHSDLEHSYDTGAGRSTPVPPRRSTPVAVVGATSQPAPPGVSAPYVSTPAKRDAKTRYNRKRQAAKAAVVGSPGHIRQWAVSNGHEVVAKGRLSVQVLSAYHAAHR